MHSAWRLVVLGSILLTPWIREAYGQEIPAGETEESPPPEPDPLVRLPQNEAEEAEGTVVEKIEFAGNRRLQEEELLGYMEQKVGMPFRYKQLSKDVLRLWESGYLDSVEVDLTRTASGVNLRILLRERPMVQSIEWEGNDEIDETKLKELIPLKANAILSTMALQQSVQKIKDAYAERGFLLARIEEKLEPGEHGDVIVRFRIVERVAVNVERLVFLGNTQVPESELREVIQTGQGSMLSFGAPGAFRQDLLEHDTLMLSALYYDKGYLQVHLEPPRVMLTPDQEGVEIRFTIHEGPRFRIRNVQIVERGEDGREIEPLGGRTVLRKKLRAQKGEFFHRAELIHDLQAIRTLYRDAGYANVDIEPETTLDSTQNEVDITLPIRRGPLVTIGRIEIKNNSKTRDKVIRREMEIEEEQLFSETKLEESKQRIMALGYFERVDISTEQGSTPNRMNISIDIVEKSTGSFQIGAGFSSMEKFIFNAQIQHVNLFGNGHAVSLQAQISSLRQLVTARFYEPYLLDSNWSLSTDFYNQEYWFSNFARLSRGGSLTLGYALIQPWLRLSLTGTLQHDRAEPLKTSTPNSLFDSGFGSDNFTSALPLAHLFTKGRTISLRPTLTYDTRNNRLFPTSGLYLQASTEYASTWLGSELKFLRHRLSGRFYALLGGGTGTPGSGFVFKMNNELGLITTPDPQGIPIFNRTFLGGILDIRGYRMRTVGPRLPLNRSLDPNSMAIPNGANIGGNLDAYTNVELEFPLVDKIGIRGVVFFDAGNSWNLEPRFQTSTPALHFNSKIRPSFDRTSLISLRTAVGLGLRWFSPFGPLRFECGFPLNKLAHEEEYVFDFMIGNLF